MSGDVLGSWVDGEAGGSIPVDDRGLQYGDGLFETMLVRAGRVRFEECHLARLFCGCERLGIDAPESAVLRSELHRAAASAPPLAVLKLIVTRGSGPRGYASGAARSTRRVMSLFVAPHPPAPGQGTTLRIAQLTAGVNPALAGLKHLNRLENVLVAREHGHEACFDSLMLDPAGLLVGGTMTNVFLVRGARVITPGVERAGVAGVLRSIVLRECGALGLESEVRAVPAAELAAADEVFITNARIGVVSVRRVGEHVYPMNTHAARLAAHIGKLDA